jgi:NAD(P)-dependent dehydrogenase (short-subunit alcohol dehydrogenase family)
MMKELKDLTVVITGASSGIGAALAIQLAAQGARVVLVARRADALRGVAAKCGSEALPVVADVTRRDEVQRVVHAAIERFGHVDVWVNNVGRGITRMPSELTDVDIDDIMRINVKSALRSFWPGPTFEPGMNPPPSLFVPSAWMPSGLTMKTKARLRSWKVSRWISTLSSLPMRSRSASVAATVPGSAYALMPKWMASGEYQTRTSVESGAGRPSAGA